MGMSPECLVETILRLGDDAFTILSTAHTAGLIDTAITPESTVPEGRRAYMRLAALVHPDKLPAVKTATDAFQLLVKAFESFADGTAAKRAAAASSSKPIEAPTVASSEASQATEKRRRPPPSAKQSAPPSRTPSLPTVKPQPVGIATQVECPRCRMQWMPDTPALYALFMGNNMKVHCDTCLLQFGSATATHRCPACLKRHTEYDCSMYHSGCTCPHCHVAYQPKQVDIPHAVLEDFQQAEAARHEREERDRERANRAAQREGGATSNDRLLQLVGQCMIDEACPICHKRVATKARQHVENCMTHPPAASKAARKPRAVTIVGDVEDKKKPKRRAKKSTAAAPKKRQ